VCVVSALFYCRHGGCSVTNSQSVSITNVSIIARFSEVNVFDEAWMEKFNAELQTMLNRDNLRLLIVDMSNIEATTNVLSALLNAAKIAEQKNILLVQIGVTADAVRMYKLTNSECKFTIKDTLSEAIHEYHA